MQHYVLNKHKAEMFKQKCFWFIRKSRSLHFNLQLYYAFYNITSPNDDILTSHKFLQQEMVNTDPLDCPLVRFSWNLMLMRSVTPMLVSASWRSWSVVHWTKCSILTQYQHTTFKNTRLTKRKHMHKPISTNLTILASPQYKLYNNRSTCHGLRQISTHLVLPTTILAWTPIILCILIFFLLDCDSGVQTLQSRPNWLINKIITYYQF